MQDLLLLQDHLTRLELPMSPGQIDQFLSFKRSLYEANAVTNLTRISEDDCEVRHFIDSLLFVDLFPRDSVVLDIGCGPGFPSWPLACARPDLKVHALDSHGKSIQFLKSAFLSNLVTHMSRAEDFAMTSAFDVVTGRALAPLSIQLELSLAFVKPKGLILPMRTANELAEVQRLAQNPFGLALEGVVTRDLPSGSGSRLVPIFRKVSNPVDSYPRPWAIMRKKPI